MVSILLRRLARHLSTDRIDAGFANRWNIALAEHHRSVTNLNAYNEMPCTATFFVQTLSLVNDFIHTPSNFSDPTTARLLRRKEYRLAPPVGSGTGDITACLIESLLGEGAGSGTDVEGEDKPKMDRATMNALNTDLGTINMRTFDTGVEIKVVDREPGLRAGLPRLTSDAVSLSRQTHKDVIVQASVFR